MTSARHVFRVNAPRDALVAARALFARDLNACLPFHNFELMGDSIVDSSDSDDSDSSGSDDSSDSDSDSSSDSDSDNDVKAWLTHSAEHDTRVEVRRLSVKRRRTATTDALTASDRVEVDYVPVVTPKERFVRVGVCVRKQRVRYVCVYVDAEEMRRSWLAYRYIPCSSDLLAVFVGFSMKVEAGMATASSLKSPHAVGGSVVGCAAFKHWLVNARVATDGAVFEGTSKPFWIRVPGTTAILDIKRQTVLTDTESVDEAPSAAASLSASLVPCRGGLVLGEPGSGRCQAAVFACATASKRTVTPAMSRHPFFSNALLLVVPACAMAWRAQEIAQLHPRAVVTTLATKTDMNTLTWGGVQRSDFVLVSSKFLMSHTYLMHVHAVLGNVCGAPDAVHRHLQALAGVGVKPEATSPVRSRKRRRLEDVAGTDTTSASASTAEPSRLTRRQAQEMGVEVRDASTARFEACTFFDVDKASIKGGQGASPFVARQLEYMADASRRIIAAAGPRQWWQGVKRPVLELLTFRGMVVVEVDRHLHALPSRIRQLRATVTWATGTEFAPSTSKALLQRWGVVLPSTMYAVDNASAKYNFILNRLCCRLGVPKPGCTAYVDEVTMTNAETIRALAARYNIGNAAAPCTTAYARRFSVPSPSTDAAGGVRIVSRTAVGTELMALSARRLHTLNEKAERLAVAANTAVADAINAIGALGSDAPEVEFIFVDDSNMYAVHGDGEADADAHSDPDYEDEDADEQNENEEDVGDDGDGDGVGDGDDAENDDENDDEDDDNAMDAMYATAEDYESVKREITTCERARETLQARADGCVTDSLGKDVCSICLDGVVQAVATCGHAFCVPCILQWYSSNQKCPTCCSVSDPVTVLVTDVEQEAPPAAPRLLPESFDVGTAARDGAWRNVLSGNMTSAMFWLLQRTAWVETMGKRVVILTPDLHNAKALTSAIAHEARLRDAEPDAATTLEARRRVPFQLMSDAHNRRGVTVQAFEDGQCHVVAACTDIVSGAYFKNVTHVLCMLYTSSRSSHQGSDEDADNVFGDDVEDVDDYDADILRAVTALQTHSVSSTIAVYGLRLRLRPDSNATSLPVDL